MNSKVPRNVFAFLHMMWGGIKHKYMTFLTPKIVKEAKKDLVDLRSDCEAIIWILENKDIDYSGTVAAAYSAKDVHNFAGTKAIIFLRENLFELCGVKFDKSLIPEELSEEDALRFYKDYPPEINIFKHLYRHYVRSTENNMALLELQNKLEGNFKKDIHQFIEAIHSISHFDAEDYAIALQDFENPERAEKFIKILEQTLNNIETKH